MDVILPFKIKNEKKFFDCAFKMGIDEMSAHKFIYITQLSDLDIFPKMGDERLNIVLYLWEMCEDYKMQLKDDEWELPEELETMLKLLVPWSLDLWFSKEWDRCKPLWKHALIHCLNRARGLLMRLPDMMQINWDFLLLYNLNPWQVVYLKTLNVTKEKTLENGALTIETEETLATNEDIAYLKLEQLPLIVLRLVKLFDQSSIDMVKTLCMRVIAAWNKVYYTELNQTGGSRLPYVPPEDKRCLLLICHIYLMATYESDDVKGYVIDNMIYNIRFYNQGFQTSYAMDNMKYTPARFIALTCLHLRLQKREFFDFFIWNSFDTSPANLFGVVSQAYKSYLLGNLLMELNQMNDEDFASNIALYKRLVNAYVNEREKSELFIANELQKHEAQRYAHNVIQCVQNMTDFKSKICKGNCMSNIGNYENTDEVAVGNVNAATKDKLNDKEADGEGDKSKDDLRVDPIFQNIPNNEEILYYVHEVLSKKTYQGWHFAKIVLLFKIISHELNMIETWRYHPGLTTGFMLNLETKLSHHYTDLAKIFIDHPFIEQEFWLTAFYLNPTSYNYEAVKRLGIRNNRKRTDEQGRWITGKDKIEAKYGLLSSTIDVKEITNLSNTDEQRKDYEPLFQALSSLHLPASMVKDIITVVFLARNKSFSWAVDWNDLRRRCKMLMSNAEEKKRFVELNMAEANDRLKFLNIDYEKYKNRPQLDYGTIEQGYENLINAADMDDDSEESEEEDDFEDDEDVYETKKGRCVKKTEIVEDDNSQEDDPYLTGKRRTRARAAAAMASILFNSEMGSRRKRRKKDEDEEDEQKPADNEEKSNDSKSVNESVESATPSAAIDDGNPKNAELPKKNIKECLRERPVWVNPTDGFQPLIDMWNVQNSDLEVIDSDCVSLFESSSVLHRFAKLKYISKGINPAAVVNDEDGIREMEMLTRYEDIAVAVAVKQEKIEESVTLPLPIPVNLAEGVSFKEEAEDVKVPELTATALNTEDIKQTKQEDSSNTKVDIPVENPAYEDHNSNSVNNDTTIPEGTIAVEEETKEIETAVMVEQETEEKKDNIEEMLKTNVEEPSKDEENVVTKESNTEKDQDQQIISEDKEENESTSDKVESLMETQDAISCEELKENKIAEAIDTTAAECTDNATAKPSEEGTENQFELPELIIKSEIMEMEKDAATTAATDKVVEIEMDINAGTTTTTDKVATTTDSEQSLSNETESKEEEKKIAESNVNKDDLCQAAKILETSEIEDMEMSDNKVLESAEVSENVSNDEQLVESQQEAGSKDNDAVEPQEKSPSNDNKVLELEEKSESNDDKVLEESEKTDDREMIESQENSESNDEKVLETSEKFESKDSEMLEKSESNDDKVLEAVDKLEANVDENLECEERTNSNNEKSAESEEKSESTNQKASDSTENPNTNNDEIIESKEILESNDDNVSEPQEKLESNDEKVSESQDKMDSDDEKVSESQDKLESNDEKVSESQEKLDAIDDKVSESLEKLESDDDKVSESQEKMDSDDEKVSESQDKLESDDDKVSESQENLESKGDNVVASQEITDSKEESVSESQGISQECSNNDDISESQEVMASNDEISLESQDIIKLNDDKSLKSPEISGSNDEDDAPDSREKIDTETKDENILEITNIKLEPIDIKETPKTDDDDDGELDIPAREKTPSEEMKITESKISSDSNAELISSESKEDNITEECPKIKSERCTDEKVTESPKSINKLTVSKKPIIEVKEPDVIIILDDDDDDDEEVDTKPKAGHGNNMPLLDSEESNSAHESGKRSSINIITKPLKVLLRRLRPSDVVNLRQPKVRLKRIKNPEYFLEEFKTKRRRFHRKVYVDIDESSDNSLLSNSSSSDAYRPPAGSRTKPSLKRHILRKKQTSDSDADSIRSQINAKSRRLSTPNASSNQSNQSARSSSRSAPGNLVVTPRSASGLKLRISQAIQRTQILHGKSSLPSVDEIIQLSSSSNDTNTMDSIADVVEMAEGGGGSDPLFEEEIVI